MPCNCWLNRGIPHENYDCKSSDGKASPSTFTGGDDPQQNPVLRGSIELLFQRHIRTLFSKLEPKEKEFLLGTCVPIEHYDAILDRANCEEDGIEQAMLSLLQFVLREGIPGRCGYYQPQHPVAYNCALSKYYPHKELIPQSQVHHVPFLSQRRKSDVIASRIVGLRVSILSIHNAPMHPKGQQLLIKCGERSHHLYDIAHYNLKAHREEYLFGEISSLSLVLSFDVLSSWHSRSHIVNSPSEVKLPLSTLWEQATANEQKVSIKMKDQTDEIIVHFSFQFVQMDMNKIAEVYERLNGRLFERHQIDLKRIGDGSDEADIREEERVDRTACLLLDYMRNNVIGKSLSDLTMFVDRDRRMMEKTLSLIKTDFRDIKNKLENDCERLQLMIEDMENRHRRDITVCAGIAVVLGVVAFWVGTNKA